MRSKKSVSHDLRLTRDLCIQLLECLGTPFSLECANDVRNGADAHLLERSVDFNVEDWRVFFRNYQAAELLSKFDGLSLAVNREDVAIKGFLLSESSCHLANIRFAKCDSVPFPGSDVSSIFHRARRKIARVLGAFSWDEAGPLMAFGPGATIGLTRRKRHAVYKFGFMNPTVTGECATFADALIGASPQWSKTVSRLSEKSENRLSVVRGSRITTVPKSTKIGRAHV